MKGTAMTVVAGTVTIASAGNSCTFLMPQPLIQKGARMDSISCGLSESCCFGVQDAEKQMKGGWRTSKVRAMNDMIGTCGRADQVELYNCAVNNMPKIVPAAKEGQTRAMIQAKGCHSAPEASAGTDGSGRCSLHMGGKGLDIDGVSTGCCDRAAAFIKKQKDGRAIYENEGCVHVDGERYLFKDRADRPGACDKASQELGALEHENQCSMIGACGKQDQLSLLKFVETMKGKDKGGRPHPEALELLESFLLESFNMTVGGAQPMMATFMTSVVTEDDATEDESHIVTGVLGFVAGAAVAGLGVTVLRRRTPSSHDEYNEIVA